ncbi:MAG TPA: glycosyltransferase family 4 protein [Nitrososphaera sp.]|jgi:glycosyltransferase involved in cell wall biosynthesis
MKANVVHMDLNSCGGAEQVAIATIQALVDLNIDVDLTLARTPDIPKLRKIFGQERIGKVFNRIGKINSLGDLTETDHSHQDYEITINTHGDVLPYYHPSFTRSNTITYCHYPVAVEFILQYDRTYLKRLADLGLVQVAYSSDPKAGIWHELLDNYIKMLKNSLIITNSSFSKKAILKVLSSDAPTNAEYPIIIPPPVSVEEYRAAALDSSERTNSILIVSRMHPTKKLETAILLASLLKKEGIGDGMIIAGTLLHDDRHSHEYYQRIVRMIDTYKVSDYVRLEVNVPLEGLKSLMRRSKVYFHPMPGEPFGISTVEAMSAGLMPVVPETGGHTDFVPKQYQFGSIHEAVGIISRVLHAPYEVRRKISDSVIRFSHSNYVKQFQAIIKEMNVGAEIRTPSVRNSMLKGRSIAA